jgi:hypothetical protein
VFGSDDMTNDQQNIKLRNPITEEVILIELSDVVSQDIIDQFYESLKHMRLKGPIMTMPEGSLLTLRECKDYADDFLYDEQQCQLHFSKRLWENFDLQDAAFFLGYPYVFPTLFFYSALPFLFEIALRADKWDDSFSILVSRLEDDAKRIDVELWNMLTLEAAQTIVRFLEILCVKAEKFEQYEDVTVINRTLALWKTNIQQIFQI